MSPLTLVLRGLSFHRRTHLGVLLGCAISSAVLVGALFVGDSVRGSLEQLARVRLGRIASALDAGNRSFRDDLGQRLGNGVAVALRVPGMAIREGAAPRQVNRIDVLGVDDRVLGLASSPLPMALPPGRVALGEKLATALGVKVGEEIAIRMHKPTPLSRDAPLASRKERDTRRALFTVAAILSDAQLGRFSLKSDQTAPSNAFVGLKGLQEILETGPRANVALSAAAAPPLAAAWTLEDAGLAVRSFPNRGIVQLQSTRIYLDPSVSKKALELRPGAAGVLSYLVNSISVAGGATTPYSFVTAISPGADPVPSGMKDDEIVINRWLAEQLAVKEGAKVRLVFSELLPTNDFIDRAREFKVRSIVEMAALAAERELAPEFPGLTDVESCKDWDVGLPMDEKELKDAANEAYWNKYKQTPKAFVTLEAGRGMWANRYGDLMSVRYAAASTTAEQLRDGLRNAIDPGEAGLVFRPVGAQAMQAARESMDLGQLFLGMSFFLIGAALLLTAMIFVFSVEQRAGEMGVLLAVGFTPARVRSLFLLEGGLLALAGSLAGVPLGGGFARFLLWGLGGAWSGAVADAPIAFHGSPGSAAAGAIGGTAVSLLAMAFALWRQAKRPIRELVVEDYSGSLETGGGKGLVRKIVFAASLLGALAVLGASLAGGAQKAAGGFFGAGALLLIAMIAALRMALARLSPGLSIAGLGLRNLSRRPGRSLSAAAMLASGCFIVFSVSAMKEDLSLQAGERRSGTGGFALYAESSIAIPQDLNSEKSRAALRLTDKKMLEGVSFVPLRLKEGDDASCLNLNQAIQPPLLGVDPETFEKLGAFGDAATWKLLEDTGDGAVPALVGDSATAMWKLRKRVGPDGDLLDYRDERGVPFKIRLVGALPPRLSVFQGKLLIANRDFTQLFPSEGGARIFVADAPAGHEDALIGYLSQRLQTAGFDAVRTTERLRDFYVVESAYLGLFMVLGGLGLLLGTAGMGVLVLRNVMERRGELALLRAVGYAPSDATRIVVAEHGGLLAAGMLAGILASAIALAPSLAQASTRVPWGLLAAFLAGTLVFSIGWIRAAAGLALRAPLVPALRRE